MKLKTIAINTLLLCLLNSYAVAMQGVRAVDRTRLKEELRTALLKTKEITASYEDLDYDSDDIGQEINNLSSSQNMAFQAAKQIKAQLTPQEIEEVEATLE